MLGSTYESQVCSISRTLEVFGERWTFLVMRNALFAESSRFVDFQRGLGVSTNVLAARLAHLVDNDIMDKTAGDPGRYRLTPRGRDLAITLIALTEWGDRWRAPHGEPVLYAHHAGAHAVHARIVCEQCGPLEDLADIEALPGPAMPDHLARRLTARHQARNEAPVTPASTTPDHPRARRLE